MGGDEGRDHGRELEQAITISVVIPAERSESRNPERQRRAMSPDSRVD
jgi:hypothetical protein